jgi:hypothetical protein
MDFGIIGFDCIARLAFRRSAQGLIAYVVDPGRISQPNPHEQSCIRNYHTTTYKIWRFNYPTSQRYVI